MYKRNNKKPSNSELVLRSLGKYRSLNGCLLVAKTEEIQKEIETVELNINYVNKEKILSEKFNSNSLILKEINKIESGMRERKRKRGLIKEIFGSEIDFSVEKLEIERLKSKLQDTRFFRLDGSYTEFQEECKSNIKELQIYRELLKNSLTEAKFKVQIKQENSEKRSKELEAKAKEKVANQARIKALAAAHTQKTRQLATTIKNQLSDQMMLLSYCPYCNNELGTNPQADHIYPVAKGGLSTTENMVFVCKKCNIRKSDKTLFEFINSSSMFDMHLIYKNLQKLGKKF